jgi:hypothetical protein
VIYRVHCPPSRYAFAWLHSSYEACLVGRRCVRRGRAPTACRAADGVASLLTRDDNFGRFGITSRFVRAAIAMVADVSLLGGAIVRWTLRFRRAWGSRGHVARLPSERTLAENDKVYRQNHEHQTWRSKVKANVRVIDDDP